MDILGVIPARGGSKGIPRKNMIDLGGHPLLWWTISPASRVQSLTRLLVTSEDDEILGYARGLGCEIRERPQALAADHVTATETVLDVIAHLWDTEQYKADAIMMLLPTSPFRTVQHIAEAIALWREETCDAVCGVFPIQGYTVETVRSLTPAGYLHCFTDTLMLRQRQEHTPLYRVNGAIFVCSERELLRRKTFHAEYTVPYLMTEADSLEIDEPDDLEKARLRCST